MSISSLSGLSLTGGSTSGVIPPPPISRDQQVTPQVNQGVDNSHDDTPRARPPAGVGGSLDIRV